MDRNPRHHRSYLLRLWRADQPEVSNWQASLEEPHTRRRIGFASLEELFAFLVSQSEGDSQLETTLPKPKEETC